VGLQGGAKLGSVMIPPPPHPPQVQSGLFTEILWWWFRWWFRWWELSGRTADMVDLLRCSVRAGGSSVDQDVCL
jgi:hypothetical protein